MSLYNSVFRRGYERRAWEHYVQSFAGVRSRWNTQEIDEFQGKIHPGGRGFTICLSAFEGNLRGASSRDCHCNLKPNNILLFPCRCGCGLNQLKIGDFRLSKIAGEGGHRGALLYTSPESLFCGMHEAPKDIWAIGCMVAEMMAGESPWRLCNGNDDDKLAQDMAFKQPQIPTGISDHVKDFLMRCFERNPNVRWTADKLLNHPFVANTDNPLLCQRWEDRQGLGNRPFGTGEWISSIGLFSTPISSCTCGCRRLEGMN
ncbi:PREDICTED: mitogen-activated protein kinase kinase kinase 2-like [Ipomoea nil]|uniref:mitogen-activated protein kinase kinase kinase 2-like n=1 Tax=Ipomoea nil TaxID=35883 RepID=UPI000901B4BC|nr:PREDICTED: mitogen-activated protein kinase kinase kinase 2-like [Ipomoea nil]